jgi:hypothetical protein
MVELAQFLFSSFWHWLGGLIYLSVIFGFIALALSEFRLVEVKKIGEEQALREFIGKHGK